MRRLIQSFGLLVLFFYADFASGDGDGDVTTPPSLPSLCDIFDAEVPPTMKMPKVSKDPKGDHLVADVACKHGYLLVPANASRLHCINGTWDEVPECKAIPHVGFTEPAVNCSMTSSCKGISVQLIGEFVRQFAVNVTMNATADSSSEMEEDGLFEIETTRLVFGAEKDTESVKVKVKDTRVSGVNKNYILCLAVLPSERNETRANVISNSCINVTVVNGNKASLKLVQRNLIFNSGMQLLSFQVGYRTCDIHVTLCLHPIEYEAEICTTFTIPDNGMDIYTVDLLQQNAGVSLEIGSYNGTLVVADDDCGTRITDPALSVQWTLTPDEIKEYSVEIWVDEGPYDVDISLDGTPSVSTIPIHMSKTLPVPFNISISTYEPSHTIYTIDGLAGFGSSEANISDFIKTRVESATDLKESYWMTLSVMTSPFVATVKGGETGVQLILSFYAEVNFTSDYNIWNDTAELDVSINTSRSLKLDDYVTITWSDSELASEDYRELASEDYSLTQMSSSVDWALHLLNLDNCGLGQYSLSMEKRELAPPTFSVGTPSTITITIGTELCFEKETYNFGDDVIIKSSRTFNDEFKLNALVDFHSIPDGVDADGNWKDGKFAVSVTKASSPNDSSQESDELDAITISFTVKTNMEGIVKLSDGEDCYTTAVILPEVTPTQVASVDVAVETTSSWSFGGMIAVLIGVVVVAVVAYVGYYNRQKIMSYVGGGGEEGGVGGAGRGLISKARKRLRSRGAYKKLPTSVQDAMTRHND